MQLSWPGLVMPFPATPISHQLHVPYEPLYQKSISSHYPEPNKNTPQKKNPSPKSTHTTPMTSQPFITAPSTATMKCKGPSSNYKITLLTRKSYPSPPMSLSLTLPTLQNTLQQTHMPSFTFPTIFLRKGVKQLDIIPQKPREITRHITFQRPCICNNKFIVYNLL